MKKDKQSWGISDIIEYIKIKFDVPENELYRGTTADDKTSFRFSLEKKIQREMDHYGLIKEKEENGEKKKYYVATEKEAMMLVDVILLDYLKERNFGYSEKDYYNKLDEEYNNAQIEARIQYIEAMQREPELRDEIITVSDEEIDKEIDRMMLRAIFNIFYFFEEDKYRKDYRNRHAKREPEGVIVEEGFSELNEKLKDPIKHYCIRK